MKKKRFGEWISLKTQIHHLGKTHDIREGEVWWCACGENVGIEINGKNQMFSRPVVILKKLSRFGFMGVPLTSREKQGSWYVEFVFLGKREFAAVCQSRVMSVSRLYNKMGTLPEPDLELIRDSFIRLYSKTK